MRRNLLNLVLIVSLLTPLGSAWSQSISDADIAAAATAKDAASEELQQLQTNLNAARAEQSGVQEQLNKLRAEQLNLAARQKDLEAAQPMLATALQKAESENKPDEAAKAKQAVDAATAELAAAKSRLDELVKLLPAQEESLKAKIAAVQQQEAAVQDASDRRRDRTVAWENLLIDSGRRLSFARHVAPVLASRCVACHNARMSKGRLNLENYAGLMKGGESGASVVPGKPDDSLMLTMILDGSMPQDADPLTPNQSAAVRRWIAEGATLDTAFRPLAALITIAPKPIQPKPPATYAFPFQVMAVAFSPDGQLIATSGYREILVWNAADGQLVRRIQNLAERPHDIEFSPDGRLIAVAAGTPAQMGEVKLFSTNDGTLVADLGTMEDEQFAVAFSPDGKKLATTGADRAVRVFSVESRQQLIVIEDHSDWVFEVVWSFDGKKLATASRDKTSKVFNGDTGESLGTFPSHDQPIYGAGFLPDGSHVATAGRDKRIRVWKIDDAKQIRELPGFGGELFRLVTTGDGLVYSASADKQVRVHRLDNGQLVKAFAGLNDWAYCVAPHPASKRVAAGCYDGTLAVWNTDTGELIWKKIAMPTAQ